MLVITFHNDGTGDEIEGNYDWKVYINLTEIAHGRVEEHNRLSGWQGLVDCFNKVIEEGNYE